MHLKLAFAGALALACLGAPAHAQVVSPSALEWAAGQGAVRKESLRAADRHFARRVLRAETRAGMLAGVYAPLAAKARELESACGSVVISGRRRTRVRGTGHWSLHASGHAVDMRGNPACIYAHLRGWPGGYSTDYARVLHVHFSLGGREDGLRFAHGRHRHRIASR
ncbi:MAG: hypothetical protein QM651_08000 [Rhodoblastus sp.]